jgi:hypothetical protein
MIIQETRTLLTKFFYEENHLHFQIILQSERGVRDCGDYTDYNEYRKAFDALQAQIAKGQPIRMRPEPMAMAEAA